MLVRELSLKQLSCFNTVALESHQVEKAMIEQKLDTIEAMLPTLKEAIRARNEIINRQMLAGEIRR